MVIRKQLHTCGIHCHYRKQQGEFKYVFLFNVHNQENSTFNFTSNRWMYYCPHHQDHNIVPYHASLLLLWSAHLNLQRIASMYWSYYLLKYAMKYEPHGAIQLNPKKAVRLELEGASTTQLQLISSLIIAKWGSPTEVALACLQIPTIHKSIVVKYIDSKPSTLRTKIVTKSRVLGFHPIDVYTNRLLQFENHTFIEKFTKSETDCLHRPNIFFIGKDNLGHYIYENNKVTRFTDFHSSHSSEGFFCNILLRTICFRNENTLLSFHNKQQSYVYECYS